MTNLPAHMAAARDEARALWRRTVLRVRDWQARRAVNDAAGPFNRLAPQDAANFFSVLETWKPQDGSPAVLVRWQYTEWCNYSCPYCSQTHDRNKRDQGWSRHALDNFAWEIWFAAFERQFSQKRVSLVITGGEPFLDKNNFIHLINALTAASWCAHIRIDTNLSWGPGAFAAMDRSKILLMCTFHPSQTTLDKFLAKIDKVLEAGFSIGIINYVMVPGNLGGYPSLREMFAKRGLLLHPNPLWDFGQYSDAERRLFRDEIGEFDFRMREEKVSPRGRKCAYPAVAYELNQRGQIYVGCFTQTKTDIRERVPALAAGPVPCPRNVCHCLDKYSFLAGCKRNAGTIDPLGAYCAHLRELRASKAGPYAIN